MNSPVSFDKIEILLPNEDAHFDVICRTHGTVKRKVAFEEVMYTAQSHEMVAHPRFYHKEYQH